MKANPSTKGITGLGRIADRKFIEELLSMVSPERVEKLKLLVGEANGTYQSIMIKRIDEIQRQTALEPIRELIRDSNCRIAARDKSGEDRHG